MSIRSIFRRNFIWLGSSTAGTMIGAFVYWIMVARYLGPLDFGRFSLVVGIGGWLISLAQSGGTTALLVLAAKEHQQAGQLFLPGIAIQAGVGILAILVSLPVVWVLCRDISLLPLVVLYGLANIALLLISVPISIFRGLDKMEWGLAFAGTYLMIVLLMFGVIKLNLGIWATIAANTIAQILMLIIIWPMALRKLPAVEEGWHHGLASRLLLTSMALWGVTIVQGMHWRVGLLALQTLSGSYDLGLYTAAVKLIENLRVLPWFLLMATFPAFIKYGQDDKNMLGILMRKVFRYILLIAFPLCIVIAMMSSFIINLIYTPDYAPSALVLKIASLGIIPVFAHWVLLNAMIALHMERQLMATYFICILVEVALDWIIVPIWGASGAAVGYVIGELLVALLSGMCIARAIGCLDGVNMLRIAIPGCLSIILIWRPLADISQILCTVIALSVYILGVFFLKAISSSELLDLFWNRKDPIPLD